MLRELPLLGTTVEPVVALVADVVVDAVVDVASEARVAPLHDESATPTATVAPALTPMPMN